VLTVALAVGAVRAADPAYVGKWKVNTAKSQMTGDTLTIGPADGGMMQFNSQGFAYKFKLDGKEYPMPDGGTTAWTATSADVWDVTNRLNGKVTNTYHLERKGDMISASGKMMKADGGSLDFTSSYKRVSGGPGFAGKWTSTEVKMPVSSLTIAASGANGITMTDDTGTTSTGQFDGKDNMSTGPMASPKSTFALRKISDSSFEVTSKLDGKPMYVDLYTVSADGKTLTDEGTPVNAKTEKYKIVFDKQ
jgi:hypothetical protein